MKLKHIAALGIKLLAVWMIAASVNQVARSFKMLTEVSLFDTTKFIVWMLGVSVIAAIVLWMLADWLSKQMLSEAEKDCDVAVTLSEEALLRVGIALIGLQILVVALPSIFVHGSQMFYTAFYTASSAAQQEMLYSAAKVWLIESILQVVAGVYLLVGAQHFIGVLKQLRLELTKKEN